MIGIDNVNEFYTNHYLAAIVGNDVKEHVQQWKDDAKDSEANTPWRRLAQLQQPFFRYKDQLERVRGADTRVRDHHEIMAQLLDALGCETRPLHRELTAGPLPLLGAWTRADGEPLLWLLAAPSRWGSEDDVLARTLPPEQHELVPGTDPFLDKGEVHDKSVEELVTDAFGLEDPPRFILILGDTEWVLADRGKWAEQRLIRFDWEELLGRRESDVLEVVTALLHRETLAPESGTSLVDTLDDSSHKHAYEVSEDLKAALRESIERIGNEAIRYRREVSKKKVYGEEIDGQQLAIECIRYMYRILFLFYIEARPELGYAPMGSEAYRLGYSLERLRELEMLELDTQESQEGFYIDSCLKRLFAMVYEGTEVAKQQSLMAGRDRMRSDADSVHHTFRMVPLRSHLFDPGRTPFLAQVKLRNEVLLHVIRAMSLSKPQGKGKHKRRGRISYATLGINQLGAVYEALLSFRGFFAEDTLYEVKPAKVMVPDPIKDPAYFVPAGDLDQYKKEERVFDEDGQVRSYPAGSFIYRMAGRDRQKSASYYTPEVLTKCLVKYALKELLENEDGSPKYERAEDLLELTICEPAMGSAAFLNEAINQLSERYLQRRQQELGERIPHDRYLHELQRVRMYIADNNVYGVDLNPIALELAEVSLWLNAIFTEETAEGRQVFVPWFGGQLACGNSLVGAWRKVFPRKAVDAGKQAKNAGWLDAVPDWIPLSEKRPEGSVYHFLLPDRGMAVYGQGNEGKPIREMCAEQLATIEAWRADICKPLSRSDREALVKLSDAVDRLWAKHIELVKQIRERTTDPLSVYGHEHALKGQRPTTTGDKDRIWSKEMASEQVRASSPYRRLKLAMDYWCALWFWPISQADLMPDRDEWLTDLALLLDKDVLPALRGGEDQRDLFAPTMPAERARNLVDEVGFADVERLIARWPRLRMADSLAERYRFHHWELEYADLFYDRSGFDLVLGNPPWVRIEWKEAGVLGGQDPIVVVRKLSSKQTMDRRGQVLRQNGTSEYLAAHEELASQKNYLSAKSNYPILHRAQPNLYKGFIPLAWRVARADGVAGLLHPEGVYDDPKGGLVRENAYPRLRRHYQFVNEGHLFAEIHNQTRYSVNVYGERRSRPDFWHVSNLLFSHTIDESLAHAGHGDVPGIKDANNRWESSGHRARVVRVDTSMLQLFARLFDGENVPPLQARLPALHSTNLAGPLSAFADCGKRLSDLPKDRFKASAMWDESAAKKDGTIRRDVRFPENEGDWILSGPHFYTGNPFNKCPHAVPQSNKSYDVIDLAQLPEDYLPRTIYVPAVDPTTYRSRAPKVPWSSSSGSDSVLDYYRVTAPAMVGPANERTVKVSIAPPGPGHIDNVNSWSFADIRLTPVVAATWASLPVDFLVKTMGVTKFRPNVALRMPIADRFEDTLRFRACSLVCLTTHYRNLWEQCFESSWKSESWALAMKSLAADHFSRLSPSWSRESAARAAFDRRSILVEIDVLVASALGLSLRQLKEMYRIQFPVLQQTEAGTWYDRHGRIVFTASVGLPRVGLPRHSARGSQSPSWSAVEHMSVEAGYTGSDTVTHAVVDDTLPGGPRERTITYQAPWVRCDRERDYEVVWKHFAGRFGLEDHS